jgi:GxxExxY protein
MKNMKNVREGHAEISARVIGCAIEVHKELGTGLLESTYEICLAHELTGAGIPFQRQVPLPINYKGISIECAYRIDLLVADSLVLELKSVDHLLPLHEAQLLTYLKLSKRRHGLLINFNASLIRDGLKSFLN